MSSPCCSICKVIFKHDDSITPYSVGEYVDLAHEDCLKQFLIRNKDDITIKATYFARPMSGEEDGI